MNGTTGLFQPIIWSLVGLIVGFIAGYTIRCFLDSRKVAGVPQDTPPSPKHVTRRKLNSTQILGIVVAALAVGSAILAVTQSLRYNAATECVAAYNQAHNEALRNRDEITARARADAKEYARSQRLMWEALLSNSPAEAGELPTRAQRDAMIQAVQRFNGANARYIAALEATDQARLTYPIPDNRCTPEESE